MDHRSVPVSCSLEAADMVERMEEWRELLTHVVDRAPIEGGARLTLDADAPLDRLMRLVRAEQSCCSFFAFAITIDSRGAALECGRRRKARQWSTPCSPRPRLPKSTEPRPSAPSSRARSDSVRTIGHGDRRCRPGGPAMGRPAGRRPGHQCP